ncbi:MAG: mannose-1-phosphate guanylyltransferase/mannose-6-phosphate isomerase, partial [Rhizobiales bacterium]|nr:mannose-1-phosphate guanylyltransferase/mannose-6-phosphate isomerase [Hyphomicrobiales bacterium]
MAILFTTETAMTGRVVTPLILCGGSGTRLWPVSRLSTPKQFLSLTSERTLFSETIERLRAINITGTPIVIGSTEQRFVIADLLSASGIDAHIILEPMRRDTAAAFAACAYWARERDPHTVFCAMPADHVIGRLDQLESALVQAARLAADGFIVTFGVVPTEPATGYGYIKPGEPLGLAGQAFRALRFIEKPDLARAREYLDAGFLWNSGIFVTRADTLVAELERLAPAVAGPAAEAARLAVQDQDFIRLDRVSFARAKAVSIDYAVMEHTDKAAVVPASFEWSDVGSWSAIWTLAQKDEHGNAVRGDVALSGTRNSYVWSDGILTAVVGLENAVVVATADAVLVAAADQNESVKSLVGELAKRGRREVLEQPVASHPWGTSKTVTTGDGFTVSEIVVRPGGVLPPETAKWAVHWVVVSGSALMGVGD